MSERSMTITERLQEVRGRRSQKEFAAFVGVGSRTYWNYESGKRAPSSAFLKKLAGLGWNPTWVLTGEGEPRNRAEPSTDQSILGRLEALERAVFGGSR